MNFYQRMGILPLKKRVNRNKCSFTTKQRMFGVFAIDEILRYRWTPFVGSRTLCHPGVSIHQKFGLVTREFNSKSQGWCLPLLLLPKNCYDSNPKVWALQETAVPQIVFQALLRCSFTAWWVPRLCWWLLLFLTLRPCQVIELTQIFLLIDLDHLNFMMFSRLADYQVVS